MATYKVVDADALDAKFTAIANAIRGKNGETAKYDEDDMPAKIAAIESGTDTTITTDGATAIDIASGKKAYVNGEMVTGSVETTTGNMNAYGNTITHSDGANYLVVTQAFSEPHLYREGSALKMRCTLSNFGDATAADVLSGKTFTSTAGLEETGTIPTIAGKTVTPSSSAQTAVSAGTYCSGDIIVAAASGGGKTGYFVGSETTTRTIDVGVTLNDTDKFFLCCSASATSYAYAVIDVWCLGSSDTNLRYTNSAGELKNPEYDGVTYSGSKVTITSKMGYFKNGFRYRWMLLQG